MHSLEPVNLATYIIGMILAPHLAEVIGPYAVIIIAATAGAGWSLGAREDVLSIWRAMLFFTKINLTAILVTVFIANIIGNNFKVEDPQWLLAPVAFIIGIIGDEWSNLGTWALEWFKDIIKNIKR